MARRGERDPVVMPNYGLWLDRPSIAVPLRGLRDCRNVRLKEGDIVQENMGWLKLFAQQLSGRVTLIDNFFLRSGAQHLLFGTPKDLYQYDQAGNKPLFLTPRYETGTVTNISHAGGTSTVTGSGTSWLTEAKIGDYIFFGATGERDPAETWYEVTAVNSDTEIEVTGDASAEATGAYTLRQIFTGENDDIWETETFPDAQPDDKDLFFLTNGVDDVCEWDGTATQVTKLPALGFTCRSLFRHKNMLHYLDITEAGEAKPQVVRNSAIANPKNVTTLEASEQVVVEGVDFILGAARLGEFMVVYSERSITLRQFVGGDLVYANRTSISGLGPVSGRVIADFGDYHEILALDTGYEFDGISIKEIGSQVFREFLRKAAPDRRNEMLVHIDEENAEVLWVIPLTTDPSGAPTTAITEHYLEPKNDREPIPFAVRDLPATAMGYFQQQDTLRFSDILTAWTTQSFKWNDRFFQANFPLNLFGTDAGFIYKLGVADNQDGAAINAWARFGRRVLVDGKRKGVLKRVYLGARRFPGATYGLGVIAWITNHADGDLAKYGPVNYDLTHATDDAHVAFRAAGRFTEIEFATNLANSPWRISAYDFEAAALGMR